jgi:tRNA uridine 5-carbamoylmethylation protein Kti12
MTATQKEYRALAMWAINNRQYGLELVERLDNTFDRIEKPGWWDRALMGYIVEKCIRKEIRKVCYTSVKSKIEPPNVSG